jgi:hypothetical protein
VTRKIKEELNITRLDLWWGPSKMAAIGFTYPQRMRYPALLKISGYDCQIQPNVPY